MNKFALCLIPLASVLATGSVQRNESGPAVLSACEVLEHLGKYRGSVIEVRGEWNGGSLTGKCSTAFGVGDSPWLNYLVLDLPGDNSVIPGGEQVGWKLDLPAWKRAETLLVQLLNKIQKSGPKGAIVEATVRGRFDTPEHLESQRPLNGYGEGGQYPGRLVVMSIRDISITNPRQ